MLLWSETGIYADLLALSGNTLLVQGAILQAFDTASGAQSWSLPAGTVRQNNEGALPTTPDTAFELNPVGDLMAIKVADGGQSWTVPRPATSEGYLGGQSVIVAYKASDGATLWRTSWPASFNTPNLECQLALGGGNLYIVDYRSGTLVCLDAKTGETKWQYHDPATSDNWDVVADDQYVFIGYNSTIRAFTP